MEQPVDAPLSQDSARPPKVLQHCRAGLLFFARHNVRPQRIDLFGFEQTFPRRHAVLPFGHRVAKAALLIFGKLREIECAFRILHAHTVARRAMPCIRIRAQLDLFRGEILRVHAHCKRQHHSYHTLLEFCVFHK